MAFNFKATPVAKTAENIRDTKTDMAEQVQSIPAQNPIPENTISTTTAENPIPVEQPQPAPTLTEENPKPTPKRKTSASTSLQASKAKKSKNGIVIDVPIDDYLEMMRLKVITGKTLKELALQAVHEFIERNK